MKLDDAVRRDGRRAGSAPRRRDATRPSRPSRNATAGKNASSELYAICCARPMQSSCEELLAGALEDVERLPDVQRFAAAAEEQAHRRADPARHHEARDERSAAAGGRCERSFRAPICSERFHRRRELLAFRSSSRCSLLLCGSSATAILQRLPRPSGFEQRELGDRRCGFPHLFLADRGEHSGEQTGRP